MKLPVIILALFLLLTNKGAIYAQSKVTCPICNGNGYEIKDCPANCYNGAIFCNSCGGRGEQKTICTKCNGIGYMTISRNRSCHHCNGNGFLINKVSCSNPYCHNGISTRGSGENKCETCKGKGYLSNKITCNLCNAKGVISETVHEKCTCNNGSLMVTCTICDGRGSYMCQRCQGYANIKDDCSKCKGMGYIYIYDK